MLELSPTVNLRERYRRLFSIGEIEKSLTLKWMMGALLLSFFITFFSWALRYVASAGAVIQGEHLCWPYLQDCERLNFLFALPDGYGQTTVYAILLGVMALIVYRMKAKDFIGAHALMLILFAWEFFVMFFATYWYKANFYYYGLILSFIFLFFPRKKDFLRLCIVLLYFLASTIKFHDGWILGTYFTSLRTGLPLFPDTLAPIVTNTVILMEMGGAWLLLSKKKNLRSISFWFFVAFHLYSAIIVGYTYPAIVLPPLLILFGKFDGSIRLPSMRKAMMPYLFLAGLIALQLSPYLIKGDHRFTLEGNHYGLFMFEANHQCVSEAKVYGKNGSLIDTIQAQSISARSRCDPYEYWFSLKTICDRNRGTIGRIGWTFDHSINGGPFYRQVEEGNACALSYHPFSHNSWIRLPGEGARQIGLPVKNIYI